MENKMKKEIFHVGGKVLLNEPTKKLIIGIVTEVGVSHITVYWEDHLYKSYSFFRPFPHVHALTEEEARNFFPDRYDNWIKEPHAPEKKKYPITTILLIILFLLAVAGMFVFAVHDAMKK